jgi:hypothetical protein
VPIHRRCNAQVLLGLLTPARAPVQCAEAKVAPKTLARGMPGAQSALAAMAPSQSGCTAACTVAPLGLNDSITNAFSAEVENPPLPGFPDCITGSSVRSIPSYDSPLPPAEAKADQTICASSLSGWGGPMITDFVRTFVSGAGRTRERAPR